MLIPDLIIFFIVFCVAAVILIFLMTRYKKKSIPLVDVGYLSHRMCKQPIKVKLKYATKKNFVGRVIDGYDPSVTDIALMTKNAAQDLCHVQNDLIANYGYGLLIYDAYRPKRAVLDFLKWSHQKPCGAYELERKEKHYPNIHKEKLFEFGYLAEDSGHTYGNTVDVVLINLLTNKKLDMGARFDYMDEKSHIIRTCAELGEEAYRNRQILIHSMQKFGFQPALKEFWHFSHGEKKGREVSKPLDIEITEKMRGK